VYRAKSVLFIGWRKKLKKKKTRARIRRRRSVAKNGQNKREREDREEQKISLQMWPLRQYPSTILPEDSHEKND